MPPPPPSPGGSGPDMGLARDQPDEEQDDDPMQFTRALPGNATRAT